MHLSPLSIRVLVIEDAPSSGTTVRRILSDVSSHPFIKVHFVEKISEALSWIRNKSADLVLLDLGMGSNGKSNDLFLHIQKEAPHLPVIILSDAQNETFALAAVRRGAQDYLNKHSLDTKTIIRAMRHAIERKRAEQAFYESEKKYQAALEERLHSEELIATISTQFINSSPDKLDAGIQDALRSIGTFCEADRSYVFQYRNDGETIDNTHEWVREGVGPQIELLKNISMSAFPWFRAQMEQLLVVDIPDVNALDETACAEKEEFLRQETQSLVCVPMMGEGRLIGFVGFDAVFMPRAWSEDVIKLLKLVGEIFAGALMRKRTLELLQSQKREQQVIFDSAQTLIWYKDRSNRILRINQRAADALGRPVETLEGVFAHELFPDEGDAAIEIDRDILEDGKPRLGILKRYVDAGGGKRWLLADKVPYRNERGDIVGVIVFATDITERKRATERLDHFVYHDILTDLPNRLLFMDRAHQAIIHARREQSMAAILYFDLDQFRRINEHFGHAAGDQLLRDVAERIKQAMFETDTLARTGEDAFALLVPNITRVEDAVKISHKIFYTLKAPFHIDGHELFVNCSIGISVYPTDGVDAERLLKNADTAMRRAKDEGRNIYRLYSPKMNARSFERMELESSLRHALERNEFLMYYQPQVDLQSGRISGVEAVIRWKHPTLGLVSPSEFIPLAEDTGLIVPIGEWVLYTACAQAKTWHQTGDDPIRLAVNLSAHQFRQRNLTKMVLRILREVHLDAAHVELEMTEGTIMHHVDETVSTLRKLSDMGLRLSVDDFGTGYSSLSYLTQFPIHTLKIDRSFVRDITIDSNDRAIVRAIISMAHSLRLDVVAEGVETDGQLLFLRSQQCDKMQGYIFSKPVPAEIFSKMLVRMPKQNLPAGSSEFSVA